VRVDKIDPPPGSLNSAVWCRNIDELIGVITHGSGYTISPDGRHTEAYPISEEDALSVVQYLIEKGKAEVVTLFDGSISWNIHHYGQDDPSFTFKKR